ncbi:MAG: hypothetical protein RJA36_1070 [Pseudomonadota bacterium]|jgi:hypothetical protein
MPTKGLTNGDDNYPLTNTDPDNPDYLNAVNLTVLGKDGNDNIALKGSFNTLNGDAGNGLC